MAKYLDLAGLQHYNNKAKEHNDAAYVAKEQGKGLSTRDFTDADKAKLDAMQQITSYNALADKPQINGTELTGNKSASDLNLAQSDQVVKLAADQTVAGHKSFSNNIISVQNGGLLFDNTRPTSGGVASCIRWKLDKYNHTERDYKFISIGKGAGTQWHLSSNMDDNNNLQSVTIGGKTIFQDNALHTNQIRPRSGANIHLYGDIYSNNKDLYLGSGRATIEDIFMTGAIVPRTNGGRLYFEEYGRSWGNIDFGSKATVKSSKDVTEPTQLTNKTYVDGIKQAIKDAAANANSFDEFKAALAHL